MPIVVLTLWSSWKPVPESTPGHWSSGARSGRWRRPSPTPQDVATWRDTARTTADEKNEDHDPPHREPSWKSHRRVLGGRPCVPILRTYFRLPCPVAQLRVPGGLPILRTYFPQHPPKVLRDAHAWRIPAPWIDDEPDILCHPRPASTPVSLRSYRSSGHTSSLTSAG